MAAMAGQETGKLQAQVMEGPHQPTLGLQLPYLFSGSLVGAWIQAPLVSKNPAGRTCGLVDDACSRRFPLDKAIRFTLQ